MFRAVAIVLKRHIGSPVDDPTGWDFRRALRRNLPRVDVPLLR